MNNQLLSTKHPNFVRVCERHNAVTRFLSICWRTSYVWRMTEVFSLMAILALLASVATVLSAPIALELSGGSVIKGDLVSWNGEQAVVKAEFGSMTFRRDQLNQATIQRLELLSEDPQKLLARISELEATVESLRKDNAALRQQLQTAGDCEVPAAWGFISKRWPPAQPLSRRASQRRLACPTQ